MRFADPLVLKLTPEQEIALYPAYAALKRGGMILGQFYKDGVRVNVLNPAEADALFHVLVPDVKGDVPLCFSAFTPVPELEKTHDQAQ
jgi:hypothetical protein